MGCGGSKATNTEAVQVVMIGLSKAGKTEILYTLKLKQPIQTIPTIGFNVETIPAPRNYQFTIFDVGGDTRLRHMWKNYYVNCEAIVFVVDSADTDRLREAKDVLFGELSDRSLRGIPLLVLANKTDLTEARTPAQIQEELHLKAIIDRTWTLDAVSAINNKGLDEAMEDLARMISENRKTRNAIKQDLNSKVV